MKFPDISLFVVYIQWRLDPHWGLCISHVVSQTNSIFTYYSLLGLGKVKSQSRLVMTIPSPYDMKDSMMLDGK